MLGLPSPDAAFTPNLRFVTSHAIRTGSPGAGWTRGIPNSAHLYFLNRLQAEPLATRSQNSPRSLVRGKGSSGSGASRKSHRGPHPSFTS